MGGGGGGGWSYTATAAAPLVNWRFYSSPAGAGAGAPPGVPTANLISPRACAPVTFAQLGSDGALGSGSVWVVVYLVASAAPAAGPFVVVQVKPRLFPRLDAAPWPHIQAPQPLGQSRRVRVCGWGRRKIPIP